MVNEVNKVNEVNRIYKDILLERSMVHWHVFKSVVNEVNEVNRIYKDIFERSKVDWHFSKVWSMRLMRSTEYENDQFSVLKGSVVNEVNEVNEVNRIYKGILLERSKVHWHVYKSVVNKVNKVNSNYNVF